MTEGKGNLPVENLITTIFTYTLNKQVYLPGPVSFGEFYAGYFNPQAIGLPAFDTFKVYMVVVMIGGGAGVITESVFQTARIVQYFVDKSLVEESLECTVNRHTIERCRNFAFHISVW